MILADGPHGPECPVCEAGVTYLGRLGTVDHWRCRACGIDFSTPAPKCSLCGVVDGHMAACLSLNPEVD